MTSVNTTVTVEYSGPAPTILQNLATVLHSVQSTPGLCCVFMWAEWCTTCKRADPLYEYSALSYASQPITFYSFDVGPEEKLVEDTFSLDFVPAFKFWRDGILIETIEGDWTKFEPFLESLLGPPTTTVPLGEEAQSVMAESRRSFVELSLKLAGDKRLNRSGNSPDSESSSGSEDEEDDDSEDEERECRRDLRS